MIFVTTGHRGSKLGAQPGVRLAVDLVHRNNPLRTIWTELEVTNGRNVFSLDVRARPLSSADGLEAENPMLMALDAQAGFMPDVVYHSIIANRHQRKTPERISDGFIDYPSAHIDGAASERIVTAAHACEADFEVIDEVRRILHVHLAEQNLVLPSRTGKPQSITLNVTQRPAGCQ